MPIRIFFLFPVITLLFFGCESTDSAALPELSGAVPTTADIPTSDHWEPDIVAFERADSMRIPAPGGVVFVGSSSIRLWKTLETDMAPLPVIQRGFGGSRIYDAVRFADRIVLKYDPKIVVVFSGTNDLQGDASDLSPEQVRNGFDQLAQRILQHGDSTHLYYISITPSQARFDQLDRIKQANKLIEAYTRNHPRLHFFDLQNTFLTTDGKIREELFVEDGLHLNTRGYALWTERMKPELLQRFRGD